jgi:hypothetical protein
MSISCLRPGIVAAAAGRGRGGFDPAKETQDTADVTAEERPECFGIGCRRHQQLPVGTRVGPLHTRLSSERRDL